MWILIVTSLWTAGVLAQKECAVDDDCTGGQYCYEVSKMCVDYTSCSRYNRKESSQPSRHARQCGKCLEGYSAAKSTLESSGEAESCIQVVQKVHGNATAIWVSSSIFFGIICVGSLFLYVQYIKSRYRFPRKDRPNAELENPRLVRMVKNGDCEIVSPASSSSKNIKNDKYSDVEEINPVSTTQEYRGNFRVEANRPVMAQGFPDPTYNPEDNLTVQTTFFLPDNEETNPSYQTFGPPTGAAMITTDAVPSVTITQTEFDNTTNTALERLGFPSPSNSQEGHGFRENNDSPEPNDADGNQPRNLNSILIVQIVKLNTNFNQGRNGS